MIVVLNARSKSGKGVPMYSRAGKSTINQYLAFSSHADSKSSKIMSRRKEKTKLDDEEKELYDLIELEEQHLQKLIQENAITNLGKAQKKNKENSNTDKLPLETRPGTSSFKAVSREKREGIEGKAKTPGVGKYKPVYQESRFAKVMRFAYTITDTRRKSQDKK